jgi:hypothetical protein
MQDLPEESTVVTYLGDATLVTVVNAQRSSKRP